MDVPAPPDKQRLERLLVSARERAGETPDAAAYVKVCYILIGLDRYAEAVQEARAGLQLHPQSGELYGYLGMALEASGSFDEAVESHEKAFELTREIQYLLILADMHSRRERFGDAEQYLNTAIVNEPDPTAYKKLGELHLAQGKYTSALSAFESARELAPHDADIFSNLGEVWLALGGPRLADALADELLEDSLENPRAHFLKARCLLELDEPLDALEHFREALIWETEGESRAMYFYCFGQVLEAVGDDDGASAAFARSYAAHPMFEFGYVAHAESLDDPDEALSVLAAGLKACPNSVGIAVALAGLLSNVYEDTEGALKVLRVVTPGDADEARALTASLVTALWEEGRFREIVTELFTHAAHIERFDGAGPATFPAATDGGFQEYALAAAAVYQHAPLAEIAAGRFLCVLYCFRKSGAVDELIDELEEDLRAALGWGVSFINSYRRSLARRKSRFGAGIDKLVAAHDAPARPE